MNRQAEPLLLEQYGERITARFMVSDTGYGLSQQQQERLFQPFGSLLTTDDL